MLGIGQGRLESAGQHVELRRLQTLFTFDEGVEAGDKAVERPRNRRVRRRAAFRRIEAVVSDEVAMVISYSDRCGQSAGRGWISCPLACI